MALPEKTYRTIAEGVDPIDPEEAAANPSFRAAVDAAYAAGRASAAEDIRNFLTVRENAARQHPPASAAAFQSNTAVLKAYRTAAEIAERGPQTP